MLRHLTKYEKEFILEGFIAITIGTIVLGTAHYISLEILDTIFIPQQEPFKRSMEPVLISVGVVVGLLFPIMNLSYKFCKKLGIDSKKVKYN